MAYTARDLLNQIYNATLNAINVNITDITPGTGATDLGKAEDAAHASGDTGIEVLAVRNDALAALAGTDGDYSPFQVDATGGLYTTAKDAGPSWTSAYTYTTSADMQTAADLTAAPTSGQKLVITDIFVSSDTQMLFVFQEETSATVIGAVRLPADGTVQLTPRTNWKLPVADKKLQGDASAAGNVYVTVFYYSEA